jgi:hypothetical protein
VLPCRRADGLLVSRADVILNPAAGYLSTVRAAPPAAAALDAAASPRWARFFGLSPPAGSAARSPPDGHAISPTTSRPRCSRFRTTRSVPSLTNHHDRTRIFGVAIVGTPGSCWRSGHGAAAPRRGPAPPPSDRARDRIALAATTLLAAVCASPPSTRGRGAQSPAGLRRRLAQPARAAAAVRRDRELRNRVLAVLVAYVMVYVYVLAQYTTTFMLFHSPGSSSGVIRLRGLRQAQLLSSMSMMTLAFVVSPARGRRLARLRAR